MKVQLEQELKKCKVLMKHELERHKADRKELDEVKALKLQLQQRKLEQVLEQVKGDRSELCEEMKALNFQSEQELELHNPKKGYKRTKKKRSTVACARAWGPLMALMTIVGASYRWLGERRRHWPRRRWLQGLVRRRRLRWHQATSRT